MENDYIVQLFPSNNAVDIWGINEKTLKYFLKSDYNSIAIIGESGIGKTAFIEQFIDYCMESNNYAGHILQFYNLDYNMLTANVRAKGEFEDRMDTIKRQLGENDGNILILDNVESIFHTQFAYIFAFNLNDMIREGQKVILVCDTKEKKEFMTEFYLSDYVYILNLEEPTFEQLSKIDFTEDLQEYSDSVKIKDFTKYLHSTLSSIKDKKNPLKMIDFVLYMKSSLLLNSFNNNPKLKKAFSQKTKMNNAMIDHITKKEYEKAEGVKAKMSELDVISLEHLEEQSKKTKIDDSFVKSVYNEYYGKQKSTYESKIPAIEKGLFDRIKGQDDACHLLIKTIKKNSLFLNKKKPLGVYLFLGASGVGKTETAMAIADLAFDSNIVRIDMSEYSEKISITRLIGAAPGYLGYDEGGQLTELIKKTPKCVLLIDELEKAHQDVFNIFLTIFDEGYCKDNSGNTISFKDCIVIMTSNLGIHKASNDKDNTLGFTKSKVDGFNFKGVIEKEMKKFFKPEFLNRIDSTIIFNTLDEKILTNIGNNELERLSMEVMECVGIELKIDSNVSSVLSKKFNNHIYGARPLKRYIENEMKFEIADLHYSGKSNGNKVYVKVDGDNIKIE